MNQTHTEKFEKRMSTPGGKLALQLIAVAFGVLLTALTTLTYLSRNEAKASASKALSTSRANKQAISLLSQQTSMLANQLRQTTQQMHDNAQINQQITLKLQHVTDMQAQIAKTQDKIISRSRP